MTGNIIIENHQGRAVEIHIEGIIGTPERDSSPRTHSNAATYARFRQQLEKLQAVRTSELIVHIRSTGGNVNDALLIHDTLRNLDCEITTRCYGYTASAATLIAQVASLEQENARLQAQPTRTKPREDPSPTESRISGNALSYNEDIRSFKQ
ncbi:ATP-dependent Clp protease proteolytic subunit [Alistipes indistinctus]|uniref:ATP-dependent Clp protease proteolytic subunit n=1 Tax=Alistipes indistinctus TaxID=626932 RepID=UPI0032C0C7E2